MRVLVSGDRGYIGAVLVPRLLDLGHEVVGLDIGWYEGRDFGPVRDDYERRQGDIRQVTRDRPGRVRRGGQPGCHLQ